MAGGTWISQNKVRPGAYINFKAVATPTITIGNRGIATIGLPLKWGEQGKLIDVYSTDLATGDSLAKVGFTADDEEAKLLKAILANTYLCKVYNLNKGGEKAKDTEQLSGATIEAKYAGEFGNEIVVKISTIKEGLFEVTTYANTYEVDTQRVATYDELVANDFVTFSGTAELAEHTITLKGGSDGTSDSEFENYLKVLRINRWQTLAVQDTANNEKAITFIKDMRENEGKYVQAVINDTTGAVDYEGIINNVCGAVINGVNYDAKEFVAYTTGMTAGAEVTISNTGKVIEGATEIIGGLDNNEIIEALQKGEFVLSLNQNGSVKVEKDINSLHTYTVDKNYTFSKNRVIRTLDEIGTNIVNTWETVYLGKVSNNDAGRTMFRSSIIDYLTSLENQGAIQNFDPSTVTVEQGNDIDSVLANISIKPVDSMEFLYMTVNVTE